MNTEPKRYQFEIAKTSVGTIVLAVYAADGFAHYMNYPGTDHSHRKIRKALQYFQERGALEVPDRIRWSDLPEKDMLDPFTPKPEEQEVANAG